MAIPGAALRLLVPIPSDPLGWLAYLGRFLQEQPDAPHGVLRAISTQIALAIEDARGGN